MSQSQKLIVLCAVLGISIAAYAADTPVLHWDFDDTKDLTFEYGERVREGTTREQITKTDFDITGLAKYVPGVSGSAMKFDGFSSQVQGVANATDDEESPMPESLTIEAWISIGAYPWNWAPILSLGKYQVTGFYFGIDSRGRLGFHMSDATSVWHECNSTLDTDTHLGLEIQKWYHVAATFSPKGGSAIYINGELAATYNDFTFDYGVVYSDLDKGFQIGKNALDLAPTEPIRDWATYPSRYSFDGIIDEIKVYERAMGADDVQALYASVSPQTKPQFESRRFPTVKSSGRFGANYTRLNFYPEWDALWPSGDYMDVVVQFDELPTKVMFWRGTRYSPCLVTENGKWMADQSRETGNNWFLSQGPRDQMPTGCIEHMSDTQCRSSRVAIIESNDARAIINWRYLQMDVQFRQQDVPNGTGFGEWGNEVYYIYPDGVTIRKVLPGYGGWQETIFLNEPGTRPEDNIELAAATLVNLKGESRSYSWEKGYPEYDLDGGIIQMVNFKSKFKPYIIFREGGGWEVFNLEVRPEYSHFPWWNHWPVAQTISDGRSANAPDRTAHSSLSWGDPDGEAALYGMTDQPAESLVALAKSWNRPAKVSVVGSAYESHGYDYTQRAYLLDATTAGESLELSFAASEASPLVNLALVVNNWGGEDVALSIDGESVPRGKAFRYDFEYSVTGDLSLVVWLKTQATATTNITLTPVKLEVDPIPRKSVGAPAIIILNYNRKVLCFPRQGRRAILAIRIFLPGNLRVSSVHRRIRGNSLGRFAT